MAVDRRSHRLDDPLAYTVVASQRPDLLFVLFSQAERGKLVLFLVDMVCLDNGGEDGEAVLAVEGCIKVVSVYTSYLLDTK